VCSSVFVAEFREEIRITIHATAEDLKNSDFSVREVAIGRLSRMGAQSMCKDHFPVGVLKRVCS